MTRSASAALRVSPPADGDVAQSDAAVPALIVLGRDEAGKPHASWFAADGADRARAAAALMGMNALPVAGEPLLHLAVQLPRGKLFASGRAFVPFVKGSVFESLAEFLPKAARSKGLRLVGGDEGAEGDKPDDGAEGAEPPVTPPSDDPPGKERRSGGKGKATHHLPPDWSAIKVGSLVLATERVEGGEDGWYESVVIAVTGETFTLKWRGWPSLPAFSRPREQLALLHPGTTPIG